MSAPPTRGNQYPCRFLLRLYRFPDLVPPRFPYPLLWRRSRVPLSQSEPHLRSGREASTSSAGILRCREGVTPSARRARRPPGSSPGPRGFCFSPPPHLTLPSSPAPPTTDLNSPFVASYTYPPP